MSIRSAKFIFLSLFSAFCIFNTPPLYSQDRRVSLQMEDKPVKEMFSAIESRTGVLFLYSDNVIDVEMRISVSAVDEPLETVLDRIFAVTGNSYLISGESVYVLHRARGGTVKDWSTPERER